MKLSVLQAEEQEVFYLLAQTWLLVDFGTNRSATTS